jgi:hypothetical protein
MWPRTVDALVDLRRNVLGFLQPAGRIDQPVLGATVPRMMYANYGTQQLHLLKAQGVDAGYVIPREGALAWLDCWAITAPLPVNPPWPTPGSTCCWANRPSKLLVQHQGLANTTTESDSSRPEVRLLWLEPVEDANRRETLWARIPLGRSRFARAGTVMKLKLGIAGRLGARAGVHGRAGSRADRLLRLLGQPRAMLTAGAEERLMTATRVLVRQLAVGLNGTARDVRMLADHPQAARLLAPRPIRRWWTFNESNVAQLFERVLDTHPEYFQMRIIDVTDHGLERIRVDRDETGLVRVSGDDLQEEGPLPVCVRDAAPASRHGVSSRARPSTTRWGAHAGLGKPSLQVAAPVHDVNGQARGVVVINVDLNSLFAQLAADLPPGLQLYLTNSAGDFLIHPDPTQAFAFDRGQVATRAGCLPGCGRRLTREGPGRKNELVTHRIARGPGRGGGGLHAPTAGRAAARGRVHSRPRPAAERCAEGERAAGRCQRPHRGGLERAGFACWRPCWRGALTRPLDQIVDAVRTLCRRARRAANCPARARTRSACWRAASKTCSARFRAQFAKLEQKQGELDRLASHDSLTGLHNRRFFLCTASITRWPMPSAPTGSWRCCSSTSTTSRPSTTSSATPPATMCCARWASA